MTVKKIPQRMCIGCGLMKSKNEMIRIVKTSDGEMHVDATGKLNGRGAYICHDSECLEKAIKSHGLERSYKISIPKETYDHLREEMMKIET